MSFITGRVYHQMDAKNRIRIPVKFKNAFPKGEQLYFFRFYEGRIAVMPESVLSKKLSVFDEVDPGNEEATDAMAALFGFTEEVAEDWQGRTQLPKWVRDYAELKKDIVTVGMGSYIEIWDTTRYDTEIASKSMGQINRTLYGNKKKAEDHE